MMNHPKILFQLLKPCLGLILGVCASFQSYAVEVPGLYDVDVPVLDQSQEVQREAFKQALEQVMVRISGNIGIAQVEGVEKVTALASRYIRKFQYRTIGESDQALIANSRYESETAEPTRILAIQFDGEAIQSRMRQMNMTTWGPNRPAVLLWVGVEQGRHRQILSESTSGTIRMMFDLAAKKRGIPLIYPQMDLEDQGNIEFGDIRGNFSPSIRAASNRYDVDIVLSGTIIQNAAGQWSAEWTVYRSNVSSGWMVRDRLSQVVGSAVDGMTDILVSRYGESGSQLSTRFELILEVDHITKMEHYAKSFTYLSSLSLVESIQPLSVKADTVRYKLQIRGEPRYLERAIALEKILQPLVVPKPGSTDPSVPIMTGSKEPLADLYYRFYQ